MNIKNSMQSIVDTSEALEDFEEVEVSVFVRQKEGGSLFIRMHSLKDEDEKSSKNYIHEEKV